MVMAQQSMVAPWTDLVRDKLRKKIALEDTADLSRRLDQIRARGLEEHKLMQEMYQHRLAVNEWLYWSQFM